MNVRVLHKYWVLLFRCSCSICSAHLGAPASRPISPELGTTTKVTPYFHFSELIINVWRFQLVARTCISVWPSSLRFPVSCCFHDADSTSGRALLLLKRMFLHMALPQTPGSTCSPGKASPNTGWPWKAKCHFKFANASCHHFWARPKPWSEPSLGLGETKFKPRMRSGTSSPSRIILRFPAHHWLAHLGTSCHWFSVLRNIK